MALPLLNETPRYEITIPSTGKKIKFRPYLVKEEKVLMMAAETKDARQMMDAILDTVVACATDKINPKLLSTFDLEYLFVKLRAKSVGETSTIGVSCTDCKTRNEYVLNLDEIECKTSSSKKNSNMIALTDKITVEMRYPSYKDIDLTASDKNEMGFNLVSSCIAAVHTEEERLDMSTESKENIKAFVDSMTRTQLETIAGFLNDIPQVKAHVKFNCKQCSTLNEFDVSGIQSFF